MTNVTVNNVRASSTVETKGAVDADVRIGDIDGEVTLIPNDASGDLSTWGPGLDYWASQPLHDLLKSDVIDDVVDQVRRLAAKA